MLILQTKNLLIAASAFSILAATFAFSSASQRPLSSQVTCVYESTSGEVIHGRGQGCYQKPGAIVLRAD